MTHKELVKRAERWLSTRCSVVLTEFASISGEVPDAIGWGARHSILVECKVSRADFLRDRDKFCRQTPNKGMGYERYFLAPRGMLTKADLPKKWGLLECYRTQVTLVVKSRGFPERSLSHETAFLSSMLRRAQIRIGTRPLSEWLRMENQFEAKRGISPNAKAASLSS